MESSQAELKAMEQLDGAEFGGRLMKITKAKEFEKRPPREARERYNQR